MSGKEKIPIEVRNHVCWCDSCFCGCKHKATNLLNNEKFKISGRDLLSKDYKITWSTELPTYAPYIK